MLGYSDKMKHSSSLTTKVWSINQELKLAKVTGYKELEVEADYLLAIFQA